MRKKFTTIDAERRQSRWKLLSTMIDEVRKPVDPEINGSARKAELQSIKQTATDCKELIVERQRLEQMIKDLDKWRNRRSQRLHRRIRRAVLQVSSSGGKMKCS